MTISIDEIKNEIDFLNYGKSSSSMFQIEIYNRILYIVTTYLLTSLLLLICDVFIILYNYPKSISIDSLW